MGRGKESAERDSLLVPEVKAAGDHTGMGMKRHKQHGAAITGGTQAGANVVAGSSEVVTWQEHSCLPGL